jgi:hypothetical protein
VNPLTPIEAADIADGVYLLREKTIAQLKANLDLLKCEGLFKVQDDSRLTGKSGGYVFRQLTGSGYIAEGEGVGEGEILVATSAGETNRRSLGERKTTDSKNDHGSSAGRWLGSDASAHNRGLIHV